MKFLFVLVAVFAVGFAAEEDATNYPLEVEVQTDVPFFFKRPSTTQASTTRFYVPISSSRPRVNVEVTSNDANAKTVVEQNEINPDGQYQYVFQTSNGIANRAQGVIRTFPGNPTSNDIVVDGAFAWKAPGGEAIDFTYTADENGYQPQSAAIPTPPPTPDAILRAIEWLKKVLNTRASQ